MENCDWSDSAAASRVVGGHLGLFGAAQHLRTQVLDGLEAADRLAELLADFGIGDRGLQRPPGYAGRLSRQHSRCQVLDLLLRRPDHGGRSRCQHHSGQRTGEVGGPQRLDLHTVAAGVDQQPLAVGRHQQDAAFRSAQHQRQDARRPGGFTVEVHVAVERQPGETFTSSQRRQQLGIGNDDRGQRGRGDRPGYQRLGRFLNHRAQILDAAARTATILRNCDAEYAQVCQAGEYRPPGVGIPPLDLADRGGSAGPRGRITGPVAHQRTCGELLIGDRRYHL